MLQASFNIKTELKFHSKSIFTGSQSKIYRCQIDASMAAIFWGKHKDKVLEDEWQEDKISSFPLLYGA